MLFQSQKMLTNIPGFDQITGGGLPRSSAILLSGETGAGKKLLTRHLTWNLLHNNAKILYFSVDQSAEELRYDMLQYGWDVASFEANGQFKIVDVFTAALHKFRDSNSTDEGREIEYNLQNISQMTYHQSLYDVEMLTHEGVKFFSLRSILANRKQLRLVIFDSISPLLLTNDESIFQMIHTLKLGTRVTQTSGIAILNTDAHDSTTIGMMKSLADATINITNVENGEYCAITLQKYVGVNKTTPYILERTDHGVTIIPMAMPDLAVST